MSVESSYAPPGVYTLRDCTETHPQTGEICSLKSIHSNLANDAVTRQHVTELGHKWPSLHTLDPTEGWNGPQPHRI